MKKLIFLIALFLSNNLFAKERIYVCTGKRSTTVAGSETVMSSLSDAGVFDKISMVIKENKVILGGNLVRSPIVSLIYEKNNSRNGSDFPICSNKNYEISFNNYSCNLSDIPKWAENNYEVLEGNFNSITNQLTIKQEPNYEHIKEMKKQSFWVYSYTFADYECKLTSSSL